jgi:hypothetical protein
VTAATTALMRRLRRPGLERRFPVKTILKNGAVALVAAAALLSAAPASAQWRGSHGGSSHSSGGMRGYSGNRSFTTNRGSWNRGNWSRGHANYGNRNWNRGSSRFRYGRNSFYSYPSFAFADPWWGYGYPYSYGYADPYYDYGYADPYYDNPYYDDDYPY